MERICTDTLHSLFYDHTPQGSLFVYHLSHFFTWARYSSRHRSLSMMYLAASTPT